MASGPRASSPPAAARADNAEKEDRFGYAFEFARALLLADEKTGDLPLHVAVISTEPGSAAA